MSFLGTLSTTVSLFLMVIIGFLCSKLKYMDQEFNRKLSMLVINVTAPFLILSSVMGEILPKKSDILPVLICGIITYMLVMLTAFVVGKYITKDENEVGSYRFMLIFGNINFLGFPVLASLFGNEAIFFAAVVSIPFNILIYLFGTPIITSGKGKFVFKWCSLFSPCLLATYMTILIVYFQLHFPFEVYKACSLIGGLTIPASLMIIGATLSDFSILKMFGNLRMYLVCLIKLLIIPCLLFLIYKLTPLDNKYTDVFVVLFGMPVAAVGTMLCLKNNIEAKTMSEGTFLTTLLSVFTIPLLTMLF